MLKYYTVSNINPVALSGATISKNDFILTDNNPPRNEPIQFGVDGVYQGGETKASGSPYWFQPTNKEPLGGAVNGHLPNNLSAGSHTITVKDRNNNVVESATFTVAG